MHRGLAAPLWRDLPIGIIGGGIAGAAMALALEKVGCRHVQVFEKDQHFGARRQGYGLTIGQASKALRFLGLEQIIRRPDLLDLDLPSHAHYIFEQDGTLLGFFGDLFVSRHKPNGVLRQLRPRNERHKLHLHLPRQDLRALLLAHLRPEVVRWGHALTGVRWRPDLPDPAQRLQLQFANGHQTSVGLLIGADGIFSVLLDLLDQDSPLRPFFEVSLRRPLNFQHLTIVNGIAPTRGHPLLHQRRFQTLDGTTRLFVMPFAKVRPAAAVAALPNASDFTHFPEDMTMWQMSFVSSLATARQFAQDTPALFAEITERCRHWHDPVPRLLAETPPSLCLAAPVYDRDPLPHHPGQGLTPPTTTPRPWVTFIGDAAHAMCPFKAQGANQALVDAMELAQALTGGGEAAPEQALARFEEQMIVRTGPKVVESRRCAVEFHQPANVSVDFFAGLRGLKTTKSIVETCRRQGIGANISSVEQLDSFISNIFRSQE